ncbi:unnamed protein product, partial [Didymodactylos carnosus]
MTIKWIFLESGHGKGVADGVGAAIKRLMDHAVAFRPNESFKNALDLMNVIVNDTSIKLFTYGKSDIDSLKKNVPPLIAVKGMASLHEVTAKPD